MLVGATPQVLANAAMTRQFDVKDEIEVKDDLDTKPDGEKAIDQFASSFEDLYRIASEISADHLEKTASGQYSFDFFVSVNPRGGSRHFSPGAFNSRPRSYSGRNDEPLRRLYDAFLPRSEDGRENFFVQFGFGDKELSFKTTITVVDSSVAASTASVYQKALARHRTLESNYLRSLIFEASKITVDNSKIIIVTRLPRAGLDTLLASDVK